MGGSLDDLIVFLLDEIALGGEAGKFPSCTQICRLDGFSHACR